MDNINVLIIDDEPPARELLKHYLEPYKNIKIAGECGNGFEALKAIQQLQPELIFLDIQMPKISGFELLELLHDPPHIIFTTAFDEFAIKAFEMNAIDYLLKPFSAARFSQSIEKAVHRLSQPQVINKETESLMAEIDAAPAVLERVVVRAGSHIVVIPVATIHYIEAQDDYVMIYAEQGRYLKEKTMKYFEQHLPEGEFIRIHRSYIVNINQIAKVELYSKDTHLAVLKQGEKLKVSAEGYKKLRSLL